MNSKHTLFVSVLIALAFSIIVMPYQFSFLADDYIFLSRSFQSNFNMMDFGVIYVRRPLTAIVNSILLKTGLFDHLKLLFSFFLCLHSFGVLQITNWLSNSIRSIKQESSSQTSPWQFIFLILICLYPSLHEVMLWPFNLPYSFGTLFLAGLVFSRSLFMRTLWMFLAFSTLETYFIFALILPAVPDLLTGSSVLQVIKQKRFRSHGFSWGIAFLIYLALRWRLSTQVVVAPFNLDFSLSHLLEFSKMYGSLLWTIHFYKTSWIFSLLEWIAFLIVLLSFSPSLKEKFRSAGVILLLPFLSSSHALIMSYYAPRAIHGAVVLKLILFGFILSRFAIRASSQLKGFVLVLLMVAYLGESIVIFSKKTKNTQILEQREKIWTQTFKDCQEPCVLSIGGLNQGLDTDWTLPNFVFEPYLRWIQQKNRIQKNISFTP